MKTALIAGATGLIGCQLLDKLLASNRYRKVIALSRRQMAVRHPKFSVVITDFHELPEVVADAEPDDVFCCLGTTMARAGAFAAPGGSPGKDAGKWMYKVFGFAIPARYKAISSEKVAQAMLRAAEKEQPGVFIHESGELQQVV